MDFIKQLTDDIFTIEYKWFNGGWTLGDSFIIEFFNGIQKKELGFYNVSDFSKWSPIRYFRNTRLFVAFQKDGKALGGYWVSQWNNLNKNGWFNFGMIKDSFSEPKGYINAAHLGLKSLLEKDDFKVLFGETSVANKAVIHLSEYFGFQKLGIIPNAHWDAAENQFCDTVFLWIDKEHLKEIE